MQHEPPRSRRAERSTAAEEPTRAPGRGEAQSDRKLELAARAAWLYHAKGRRQDEIARELNISRQIVQRLIALAAAEGLIRFQLIHPLSECIELAERLRERFGPIFCEVAPTERGNEEDISSVATAAALYLETLLGQKEPLTIGIGNGAAMRETTLRLPRMNCPQHTCVSLMGNLTRHGRASHYDVVMRMSERIGAQSYPMPMPVVANSVAEREVLQAQLAYRSFLSLVSEASILLMGIGFMDGEAPLHRDGFITEAELREAQRQGAIGELLGHGVDAEGRLLTGGYHDRLTSYAPISPPQRPTMIVQTGRVRVPAIRAALDGKLANCLITDENTARLLLA